MAGGATRQITKVSFVVRIEQAVFTSTRSTRLDGYQLAATSPGVAAEDARQLARWGPAHDSLSAAATGGSINFHRLPTGANCISKTTLAGAEYSGRGGGRVYTQCLIVCPALLERFANNPFRILEAAIASGRLRELSTLPPELDSFPLAGGASAVDRLLLSRLVATHGPELLCALLEATIHQASVGVVNEPVPARLFAAVLNLLPLSCRTQVSFSTGLIPSGSRVFRLSLLPGDEAGQRQVVRQTGVVPFDVHAAASGKTRPGWVQLVQRFLDAGKLREFSRIIRGAPRELTLADLDRFGGELQDGQFAAPDADFLGRLDANLNLAATQSQNADGDIVSDHNFLLNRSR